MFTRTIMRGILVAVLSLQTLASAAEATVCDPCTEKVAAVCTSSIETAAMSGAFSEGGSGSSLPASHQKGDDACSFCPLCLHLFIKTTPMSVPLADPERRIAAPEHPAPYEAPSFSLLRPPIA